MTKRCSDDIIEIEIEAVQKQVCADDSLCGQVAEFVSQSIDIGEPIENLKKLLEPRLQCSLENHHICLQDIQLDPGRSLFDQGVKTDGMVQLSVQVISRQGVEPRLNILEIIKPVETVEVVIDPDAAHHEDMTATQVITVEGGKAVSVCVCLCVSLCVCLCVCVEDMTATQRT
uniref:GA-binding protein alpha chain-like n=1 Tax=Petromyzon marinus TaxID=7757 RepID=A0AAJ7UJ03_PETMA|nr:GA-binding protein alpha chain-like [Petromyzon marinus]